jgi:hypothetical protein
MSCDNQHANIQYTCKFETCKVRYKNLRMNLLLSKVAFTSDKHDYSTIPYFTILTSSCAVQSYTIIIPKTLKTAPKNKHSSLKFLHPSRSCPGSISPSTSPDAVQKSPCTIRKEAIARRNTAIDERNRAIDARKRVYDAEKNASKETQ